MESFGARQDTFINGIRIKTSSNSKSRTLLKWPHSAQYIATPETLADAGFFFSPSATDRDNVQCFACGKELSEWEKDDDPYSIHYDKCGRTCWWAMVRCGLEEERDKRGRWVSLSHCGDHGKHGCTESGMVGIDSMIRTECLRVGTWNRAVLPPFPTSGLIPPKAMVHTLNRSALSIP
jgi:hypothetical protein